MMNIDKNKNNINPADAAGELPLSVAEVQESTDKMKELVEALLKKAKPEEQAELKILYNAMVNNADSYQADTTATNLKDWRESKNELASVVEKLSDKYDHSDKQNEEPDFFNDLKSVLPYLQGKGYKISQAALYNHLKDGKFSKDRKTGKFLTVKINNYAHNHLVLLATGKKEGEESSALAVRKLKAETKEREAKASKAEYELKIMQGKYIDREDMVRELVGRALIMDSSLRHLVKTAVPEIIDLVSGDQTKAGVVMDELMRLVDETMNSFASTEDFVVDLQINEGS